MRNTFILIGSVAVGVVLLGAILHQKHTSRERAQIPPTASGTNQHPISPMTSTTAPVRTIGAVTRHAQNFLHTSVRVKGYLLKKETGYVIFSDEPSGSISKYDLPVMGTGIDAIQFNHLYLLEGVFNDSGLAASNKNPDNLQLSVPPTLVK